MSFEPLLPPATLGVVGGGQLGRMFGVAARRLGYGLVVLDPTPDCPAAAVADHQIVAGYDDLDAARELGQRADRITFEFENAPASTLAALAENVPVRPRPEVLEICRHRVREKHFLRENGFPVGRHAPIANADALREQVEALGPAILKRALGGYDGKGQSRIQNGAEAGRAWEAIGAPTSTDGLEPAVLEQFVAFQREVSVIVARGADDATEVFPVFQNDHTDGILDVTRMPAEIPAERADEARDLALRIARALNVVGLLTVEMFDDGNRFLVNELAPRPHNSGHVTIEAAVTCQFEQHVRALCDLPLGSPDAVSPGAMANLLGERWGTT
ncbi:MAG: 5-(carboxyamino)imidazole ribonucleotide synthase, partial [Planctomycetota bacterium]